MAKVNKKTISVRKAPVVKVTPKVAGPIFTHGGAKAQKINAKLQLQRSVLTSLLWEDSFYESGDSVARRISALVPEVNPVDVVDIAFMAKFDMKLRHAPLYLMRELSRYTPGHLKKTGFEYAWDTEKVSALVESGINAVIRRPDEVSEFLAMYWKDKKQPISAAVKRGLAKAFSKFNEYQLAKWNKDKDIKLRDVMFLTHPNPKTVDAALLFKKLADKTLATPDTWEVALSAGKDKRETFERLLREGKLGGMALLKNLRNMTESGVDGDLIRERLERGVGFALPFQFITAAKYAPRYSTSIEVAMLKSLEGMEKLPGRTLLVVDTSGSMFSRLSKKSEMTRMDAAAALSILARNLCEESVIYATAGNDSTRKHATMELPEHLSGFALSETIVNSQRKIGGGGIFLVQCLEYISKRGHGVFDRVVVFTDEQDCDVKANPQNASRLGTFNYVVNVANEKNGISYKNTWDHVDGFSERIFDYIRAFEKNPEVGRN
jgi:60 kDa SS-A/Ro ribonucleoprotein